MDFSERPPEEVMFLLTLSVFELTPHLQVKVVVFVMNDWKLKAAPKIFEYAIASRKNTKKKL